MTGSHRPPPLPLITAFLSCHGGLGLGRSSPCEPTPCVEEGRRPAGWPGRLQEEGPCGIFGGRPPHSDHGSAFCDHPLLALAPRSCRYILSNLQWPAGSVLWGRPRPAPGSQVAQPPARVCFSLGAEPGLCAGLSGRLSEVLCASHRVGLTGVVLRMWDLHFLIV